MTVHLLTGSEAAAWGARLAQADFIPTFPRTRQSAFYQTFNQWIEQGEFAARLQSLDSEHAMINAATDAASHGLRVFSAASGQGLLYAMKMLFHVSGWRAPLVMVNFPDTNEAAPPLDPEHTEILAACDNGFLRLHCVTCQEVLDMILLAYRMAEHEEIHLPVLVNQDVASLCAIPEPVVLPSATSARQFVGSYHFTAQPNPRSDSETRLDNTLQRVSYAYFRYDMHLVAQRALAVYDEVADEFADFFGRRYPMIEDYRSEDADYVFVMMDAFASKAKDAIDRLRESGWRVGLLRPRLVQPFPHEKFASLLSGKLAVAVIDQHISMGRGGVLHSTLCTALYGKPDMPSILASFIGGLGGREITTQEYFEMASKLRSAVLNEATPPPHLLCNEAQIRGLQFRTTPGHPRS